MKQCRYCKKNKEFNLFGKNKKSKDGHSNECRQCRKERYERKRPYYLALQKTWDTTNRAHKIEYIKKRKKEDPAFYVLSVLRSRLKSALKGNLKTCSTKELVGCSPTYLRKYIELQFRPGMKWDNIHIDHMMPCCSFDMSIAEEQKRSFHYTNLQPLFPFENMSKSGKIVYDMVWHDDEWYKRDPPELGYHARSNILVNVGTMPKAILYINHDIYDTLLIEITAMCKSISQRLNKIDKLIF